jgi:YVTN family beta-propeller protein
MTTDTVISTISVGTTPISSTVVGTKLYVNNKNSNNVSVIDTITDTVLSTFTIPILNTLFSSTVVGSKLYINSFTQERDGNTIFISIIDTTTDTVVSTISINGLLSFSIVV